MSDLFSVKDKVVLITGAAGGIGSALVEGFWNAGALVAAFVRKVPEKRFRVDYYEADLSNYDEIVSAFHRFLEDFRHIDVLINCAGKNASGTYSLALWHKIVYGNLNAVFYASQLVGTQMVKQGSGGSIINFTSIHAAQAMPNNPAYGVAKASIRHLTKNLANDWGKYGIRVNNLGPGYTETRMNQYSIDDPERYKARANLSMLNRWAKPEEMVGPAIFLASDASSFVTACDLWVDGGKLSKGL